MPKLSSNDTRTFSRIEDLIQQLEDQELARKMYNAYVDCLYVQWVKYEKGGS